jgi:hypothetical protein
MVKGRNASARWVSGMRSRCDEDGDSQPPSRLTPASRNSAAPVPRDRCARARRNCTASPALVGGGAARRVESLSAVALPEVCEKGGGEGWRWVSKPKPCAPCRKSGRGRQKEQMRCVVTTAIRAGSPSGSRGSACAANGRFTRANAPSTTPRIVRFTAAATIAPVGEPGVFGASVRRGEQHFDVGSEGRCTKEIAAVAARG